MRSTRLLPVLLAFPGVALGLGGLLHPHRLLPENAERWYLLHLAGLVLFPLVGLALAAVVRGRSDPLAWVVRLSAYGYATFYTALDVIYGVGAGDVTRQQATGYERSADFSAILRTAVDLGEVGSWSLLVCAIALLVDGVRRDAWLGLVLVALPIGAWLVHSDHIFSPSGAAGIALVGVATGWAGRKVPPTRRDSLQPFAR